MTAWSSAARRALRGAALASCIGAVGCGRVQTVWRGATSVFRPSADAERSDEPGLRADARLTVQWVGHATTLVQLDDRMLATDPLITATAGLLSKRLVDPGVSAAAFPAVDLAVISHQHFDHLSYGSLEALQDRISLLAIPGGAFPYLPNFAFDARSVPAWESFEHRGLRVTAVPAAHTGWRYAIDAGFGASPAGWVIEYHGLTVYFAGDTGYDEALFAAIRARFPQIDVALLPIAPMEPHELIGKWHIDPAEAVRAFRELGAREMVPIHFDTFINSLDDPGEAPAELRAQIAKQGVDPARVHLLAIGERRVLLAR